MRVSFDSNAWEKIFDRADTACVAIRAALESGKLRGFICEAGFRIEAIRKLDRATYFAQPHMDVRCGIVMHDGRPYFQMSFGPDDQRHPGLPAIQADKLQRAISFGVLIMRGLAWMGLPAPAQIENSLAFVRETSDAAREREQRQIDVSISIGTRGVGKAIFDAAGGWNTPGISFGSDGEAQFQRACAEWADGELVAAHVAYQNDILCTQDHARGSRKSIFDPSNREWLTAQYGVVFRTLDELIADIC